jgi:hypothetical protein
MGRARHGIGGLARRIRPVGRLAVGNLPDGRGHLVATGGHLQRQVLHTLRFDPAFVGAVPCPVAIYYSVWRDGASTSVHILDGPAAVPTPGAVRAPAPHVPAYLVGFLHDRRQLLDIFAQRSSRHELLSAVSAAFAELADWDYRVVWGETFRDVPALANVEFLRGYAGCPVPEGLTLAIDLTLGGATGPITVGELGGRVAAATGLDRRVCTSAILRLVWAHALFVDLSAGPLGLHSVVSRSS